MKIALLSDIHGNIRALSAVLKDIRERGIQDIYCAGDLVGYHTAPDEVVKKIKEEKILTAMGNHDEAIVFFDPLKEVLPEGEITPKQWTFNHVSEESREYLKSLYKTEKVNLIDKKMLIAHGSPEFISEYIWEEDEKRQEEIATSIEEDIFVFGHTHSFYDKEVLGKRFINLGSVGRPKDGDTRAGYVILSLGEDMKVEYVRVDYDNEALAREIEESELPDSFADVIRGQG